MAAHCGELGGSAQGEGGQVRQGPLIHKKVKQGGCLPVGLKRAMNESGGLETQSWPLSMMGWPEITGWRKLEDRTRHATLRE